jgi:hypothetical protein
LDAADLVEGFAGTAPDEFFRSRSDVLTNVVPDAERLQRSLNIMDVFEEAWADVARLQNSLRTASSASAASVIDNIIDRLIDRIESGEGALDSQSIQCGRATASRRERHQARLMRLHVRGAGCR